MILLYQRIIPNYRLPIFERLISEMKEVKVVYGQKNKEELTTVSENLNPKHYLFSYNYYMSSNNDLFYSNVVKYLFSERPNVVITVGNLGNLSLLLIFLLKYLLNYKIIIWSHGWNIRKGFLPDKSFIDKARLFLFKRSDSILLYNKSAADKLANYLDREKIFVANNTLDTSKHECIYQKLLDVGRNEIKSSMGLKRKFYLVFLGKLIESKNPFQLVQIYESLKLDGHDLGLIFIGDGSEAKKIKTYINENYIRDVHLLGQLYDDELIGKYLFSSDLMIIPGFVGLAVIHSFVYRCPVMTHFQDEIKGPLHSPEVDYINDGLTGFLIENGNVEIMKEKIIHYLNSNTLQNTIKTNIERLLKEDASVKKMIEGFLLAIKYVRSH